MRLVMSVVVLCAGALMEPAAAAAREWDVRCNRDGVCALYVDALRVPLRGDADAYRGPLRCAGQDDWLACSWLHATQLHLNDAYFIHLPTRRVRQMTLDSLTMDETGAFGRLLGRPRWQADGARLVVEQNGRRYWIWRRRPR